MIDPELLDPEIRELVRLLNLFPGVRTYMSCEGHLDDAITERFGFLSGWVVFDCDDFPAVRRIFAALRAGSPNEYRKIERRAEGVYMPTRFTEFKIRHIADNYIRCAFTINGWPEAEQRECIRLAEGYMREAFENAHH